MSNRIWAGTVGLALLVGAVALALWSSNLDTPASTAPAAPATSAPPAPPAPPAAGNKPAGATRHLSRVVAETASIKPEATHGTICVDIVDAAGLPIPDIALVLQAPSAQLPPWDDSAIPGLRDQGADPSMPRGRSNPAGEVWFSQLEPGSNYQLAVVSDGVFAFAAKPTPFSAPSDNPEPNRQRVVYNRSMRKSLLESTRVSGFIPVTAGVISRTKLVVFRGSSLDGLVEDGPWDRCIVRLLQLNGMVRTEAARAEDAHFRFTDLVPTGKYHVEAQMQKGNGVFFASAPVTLRDGEATSVALRPFAPHEKTKLYLRFDGDVGPPPPSLTVHITLYKRQPFVLSDFLLTPRQPIVVHGMWGSKVMGLIDKNVEFPGVLCGRPYVQGLSERRLIHEEHAVVIPCETRGVPNRKKLLLIPPPGMRYTIDVEASFTSHKNSCLGTADFPLDSLSTEKTLDWTLVGKVTLSSQTPLTDNWRHDPHALTEQAQLVTGSERVATITFVDGAIRIEDPGPPNSFGVESL